MKRILTVSIIAVIIAALTFSMYGFNKQDITILIVGDILLDRGVGDVIDQHSPEYPYMNVKNILPKADIAFGNLECPITSRGTPALKRPYYLFRAALDNADALKKSGFDVLNLANNHTMDYGREGIMDTIDVLNNVNIKTVGAGQDKQSAHKPLYMEISGTVIGFLSFSAFPSEGYIFLDNKPDVAQLDLNTLADEVKSAKSGCDILITSFHWGNEFENYPTESQKKTAHLSVENGADIVIGHHPHVLQGMEFHMDKPIFYSLGNFVFDSQEPDGTDETVILKLHVTDKSISSLKVTPIRIIECQPTILESQEGLKILNNFEKFSNDINSNVQIDKEDGTCFMSQPM